MFVRSLNRKAKLTCRPEYLKVFYDETTAWCYVPHWFETSDLKCLTLHVATRQSTYVTSATAIREKLCSCG